MLYTMWYTYRSSCAVVYGDVNSVVYCGVFTVVCTLFTIVYIIKCLLARDLFILLIINVKANNKAENNILTQYISYCHCHRFG